MSAAVVKTVKGEHIPGTWRAVCTCGWEGNLYGSRGARSSAIHDRWQHQFDHEDETVQR